MAAEHPARESLVANLSFNVTQLKDLEYICELAELFLKDSSGIWPERIARYRAILMKRIDELETQLNHGTTQPEV